MIEDLLELIQQKEQEILDFMIEQKQYDEFDIAKKNDLDDELLFLKSELKKIKKLSSPEPKRVYAPFCKRCNKKMKLRKAEKGTYKGKLFYGCINFPECKNTIDFSIVQ